jgi:hypothetical protein
MSKSGIYIKPSKRDSLHDHLGIPRDQKIPKSKLAIKKSDSSAIKKKKQFAINASNWNHQDGGDLRSRSDSLTNANKDIPWIKRYLEGNQLSIPDPYNPGSGKTSSHGLSYHPYSKDSAMIYPEIIQQGDSLIKMNNDEAREYAMKNKTGINTDLKLAKYYSENGLIQHGCGGKLKRYEDGGEFIPLPEYGFGSWLKENAGGLLKGASSLVSAIPVVGQIAAPVLNIAGSAIQSKQAANAQDAQNRHQQALLDEQAAAQAEIQAEQDRQTRLENIIDKDQIDYGPSFMELGGQIGMGMMGDPQIVDYTNGSTHQEGVGGIPVDIKGNPATTSRSSAVGMTERGEVTWNGYVFSNKLKLD